MSGVLIIGPDDEVLIKRALETARARPLPWAVAKAIADRGPRSVLRLQDRIMSVEDVRAIYPTQHIVLGTYRCALSFEEQPAGLFKHLSVSSERSDKVPGMEAMQMVCEAFGFSERLCRLIGNRNAAINVAVEGLPSRVWLEEFDKDHYAVNVIELVNEVQ